MSEANAQAANAQAANAQTPILVNIPAKIPVKIKSEKFLPHVLSFDIGIIHLSFCARNKLDEITAWEVVNILDPLNQLSNIASASGKKKVSDSVKCDQQLHNLKRRCKKNAAYFDPSKQVGYCELHAKQAKTQLVRYLSPATATEWDLKLALYTWLDSHPEFLSYPTILIEHQPNKATQKIKGIAHALYDYFVLKWFLSQAIKPEAMLPKPDLIWMDPRKKLMVYTEEPLVCKLKTQYARNKWFSKQYTEWYLNKVKPQYSWYLYFMNHRKRDDLADCLLQSVAWSNGNYRYNKTSHCRSKKRKWVKARSK